VLLFRRLRSRGRGRSILSSETKDGEVDDDRNLVNGNLNFGCPPSFLFFFQLYTKGFNSFHGVCGCIDEITMRCSAVLISQMLTKNKLIKAFKK